MYLNLKYYFWCACFNVENMVTGASLWLRGFLMDNWCKLTTVRLDPGTTVSCRLKFGLDIFCLFQYCCFTQWIIVFAVLTLSRKTSLALNIPLASVLVNKLCSSLCRRPNLIPVSNVCEAGHGNPCSWPATDSPNYWNCVSNFLSTWLANRQCPDSGLFNRPIMALTQTLAFTQVGAQSKDFGDGSQTYLFVAHGRICQVSPSLHLTMLV